MLASHRLRRPVPWFCCVVEVKDLPSAPAQTYWKVVVKLKRKMHTMVIANRHEIAGAGMEALLMRAGGHRVVAHCSREDDLLHVAEVYRPDVVMLAKNLVSQDA